MPLMDAHIDDVTTLATGQVPLPLDFRSTPYNLLPLIPPKVELETKRTLKKAIAANKALAELRTAGDLIPNQGILIRAIILQEAKMSSEIENIVTTNDELYRAFSEDPEKATPETKEVLRYEEALWHGYNELLAGSPLSVSVFVEIVSIIKEQDMNIRRTPGTRIVNRKINAPIYAPPEGESLIREKLENLIAYIYAEDDVDPLIKMAVMHYQFEAIHPFPDGNGRTGRVLNILYLVCCQLLGIPVLYLSRYIIQNKSVYYEGLRRVTEEQAWEDWVVYLLEGIEQTAIYTKSKIISIREALVKATDYARVTMRKGYSKELIELIFQQPCTRIATLEKAGIAKRDAASLYLRELERIGMLARVKIGREMLFINKQLLDLLST